MPTAQTGLAAHHRAQALARCAEGHSHHRRRRVGRGIADYRFARVQRAADGRTGDAPARAPGRAGTRLRAESACGRAVVGEVAADRGDRADGRAFALLRDRADFQRYDVARGLSGAARVVGLQRRGRGPVARCGAEPASRRRAADGRRAHGDAARALAQDRHSDRRDVGHDRASDRHAGRLLALPHRRGGGGALHRARCAASGARVRERRSRARAAARFHRYASGAGSSTRLPKCW